ncbi:hypothetical protein B0H11DRAFT_2245244 [Mycena galericulata]|nr:hypothetical protein B0H11DRAFT_2245244 [Mycena galericulata]
MPPALFAVSLASSSVTTLQADPQDPRRRHPLLVFATEIFPMASRKALSHNGLEPTIRADGIQLSAGSRSN